MVYAESPVLDLRTSYEGEVPPTVSASAPVIALPVDAIELSNFIRIVCFTSTPQIFSALLGFLPMPLASWFTAIYVLIVAIYIAVTGRWKINAQRARDEKVVTGH